MEAYSPEDPPVVEYHNYDDAQTSELAVIHANKTIENELRKKAAFRTLSHF